VNDESLNEQKTCDECMSLGGERVVALVEC